jgi:hypothetical protein
VKSKKDGISLENSDTKRHITNINSTNETPRLGHEPTMHAVSHESYVTNGYVPVSNLQATSHANSRMSLESDDKKHPGSRDFHWPVSPSLFNSYTSSILGNDAA